jgi:hypothetical protein
MAEVIGIDIGTSTIKVSRRVAIDTVVTERVARTPSTPGEILRAIERLAGQADTAAFSSFRRALVVDDYKLVLARSSPPEPVFRPTSTGRIDALNPLAPIHRWLHSVRHECPRFQTFDVWLSERLTGRSVCAESQAWLTGLWDTERGAWDESACVEASISPEDLPEVRSEAFVVGGACLPVLGDHEGTALACASAGEWPLNVAECGTALACMIGGGTQVPRRLGFDSPIRCGYTELVDPYFAQRLGGASVPAPRWMAAAESPSASEVVLKAFRERKDFGDPVVLCGGNVTRRLMEDLAAGGLRFSVNDAYTSSAGALMAAERAIAVRKRLSD